MLEGVVTLLPMEELPEDISDFYAAFELPYVVGGVQGAMPQTVAQEAEYGFGELWREQVEEAIRAEVDRQAQSEQDFVRENMALTEFLDARKPLTDAERELAVAFNLLLAELDRAEHARAAARQLPEDDASLGERCDYAHAEGIEHGLREAGRLIGNELSRRQLPRASPATRRQGEE